MTWLQSWVTSAAIKVDKYPLLFCQSKPNPQFTHTVVGNLAVSVSLKGWTSHLCDPLSFDFIIVWLRYIERVSYVPCASLLALHGLTTNKTQKEENSAFNVNSARE